MRNKKLCNIDVKEDLGEESIKNFLSIIKDKPKTIENLENEIKK